MGMREEMLVYPAGDVTGHGYLVLPDASGIRPAILLAPEGPGLSAHAKLRARGLAERGYVVLAMDPYGEGYLAGSHEEVVAMTSDLLADRHRLLDRTTGALNALKLRPEVDADQAAAIGYCFGGLAVLDLARSGAAVRGVVTFHGILTPPTVALSAIVSPIRARILACTGADDHLVPAEQVRAFQEEMRAEGADWQMYVYGGARHAFTNEIEADKLKPLGFGYDRWADWQSWSALLSFLDALFKYGRQPQELIDD